MRLSGTPDVLPVGDRSEADAILIPGRDVTRSFRETFTLTSQNLAEPFWRGGTGQNVFLAEVPQFRTNFTCYSKPNVMAEVAISNALFIHHCNLSTQVATRAPTHRVRLKALFIAEEALAQAWLSRRARKTASKGSAWIGPSSPI